MFNEAIDVQYNPKQCPNCSNNFQEERCYAFVTKSYPRDILGVFSTITEESCPKYKSLTSDTKEFELIANEIRQENDSAYSLNCKGVAEKDPVKSAIYYFVALEKAIKENSSEQKQIISNLSFASENGMDLKKIKEAIGFNHDITIIKKTTFNVTTMEEVEKIIKNQSNLELVEVVENEPEKEIKVIETKGDSENLASGNAKKTYTKYRPLSSREVCEQKIETSLKLIEAYSESEVNDFIKNHISTNVNVSKIECVKEPKQGFMGINRKHGEWRIYFEKKIYICSIYYMLPATITIRCKEAI